MGIYQRIDCFASKLSRESKANSQRDEDAKT